MRKLRGLMSALLAMVLVLGCASGALAWAPEWEHDEDLSGYKLCDNFGDIKLTIAVTDHSSIEDWETNSYVKWLEDVTNVDLSFELIPFENRAEKLSLILASGEYPDIFLSVGMTDAMVSKYGVEEGMFLPLNDLIEKYGNFTKQVFDEYPGTKDRYTQLDGNIYSLPEVNECYHCKLATKAWINETWLKNLGLEKPTTLDEFRKVLEAFRDKDANGNGDPNDEIPFAGDYQDGWYTNGDRLVMNAFTYYNLDLKTSSTTLPDAFGLYLEDGKVTVPFYKPEFKKGVQYMADLVKDGLYYTGSFTQDSAGLTQIGESGRLGAACAGYILFTNLGDDMYKQYGNLLPLKGPDGYQNVISFPYDATAGNMFVISADTKNPEAAFKIGDLMYSYASSMRSYYGVYGQDWTNADPGQVGINGEPAFYKILVPWQETEPQNKCVLQLVMDHRDAKYRLGEPSDPNVDLKSSEGLETYLYQVTKAYEPFADDSKVLPPLKFTDEENNAMSVIKANLSNSIKQGMFAFFNGTKTLDKDYDAWISELEANGPKDLMGYYQSAYDAQYKK